MTLHLEEWGEPGGKPLVCVHGVQGAGGRYGRMASRLPGYHVVAPDLRGHGRSTGEPPWDIAQHLDDLLTSVPFERADWIGHSFGGRLVVELAARHPERVARAVLLDPALQVLPHVAGDLAETELPDVSFGSTEEAIEARLASGRLFRTPRAVLDAELPALLEQGLDGRWRYRHSRTAVIAAWSEMATPPPPYPRIPTLLVVGGDSLLVLDEQQHAYRQALGDLLEIATVPGGHILLWDAFEETTAAVSAFLAS